MMKRNLPSVNRLNSIVLPLLITVLLTGFLPAFAQDTGEALPDTLVDPREAERNPLNLKSAEASQATSSITSYNGNYNSDYYIYFKYSGYSYGCDCSDSKYKTYVTIGGTQHYLGQTSGTSYSNTGLDLGVGPSKNGTYSHKSYEQGDDDYVWPTCWTSCGRYYSSSGRYYSTASIRNPKSPTATNGKYDYRIDLTWKEDTDIPNDKHGYIIKRDGIEIGRVINGAQSYSDNTLGPGETHTYTIQTMYPESNPSSISSGITVVGKTFDMGLEASTDQTGVINLNWTSPDGKGKAAMEADWYSLKRYDEEKNNESTIPQYIGKTTTDFPDDNELLIPGYLYRYVLQPLPASNFYPDTTWGKTAPNGRISGKVLSPTGLPVSNVQVCAKRLDEVPQDTTSLYCAVTDSAGEFEIRNIYYYEESQFRLFPSKGDHGFQPAFSNKTLRIEVPALGGIVFTDTSAFTLTGRIVQLFAGDTCPVTNVGIYLDDAQEPEVTTDQNGNYALSVGQIGEYTLTPALEQHTFNPAELIYLVSSDTMLQTIVDSTRFTLSGFVRASCETFIGRASLMISSGTFPDYCLDTTIMTDESTGYYEIELPARQYTVELKNFSSENLELTDEDVEAYFTGKSADLTFGDKQLDFIYRSDPELSILGFLEYGCGDYADVPIIEQGFEYTVNFEVKDVFGENSCLADTGYIVIQNNLVLESNRVDTIFFSNGLAAYSFVPGGPNLTAPHFKNLTATAYLGSEIVQKSVNVLVEGNRPRENTFTTVSPEIPFMILRDPPGDASYSYLEENTTTQTALKFSGQMSGSIKAWAELKVGTKFQLGIFGSSFETEIWGKVRGSLEVGASVAGQEEFSLNITNGEAFKTSDNQNVTGESGDVFAGSALNMIYALTDVVEYNEETCSIDKTVTLSMGVDDFATTFLYTENHIQSVLIPQLAYLRDLYEREDNDSSVIYANQIDVWQQTLKLNKDLKEKGKFIDNISFSSGSSYESFQEVTTTESVSIEFSMFIESAVAIEAGIEIAGVGASAGVEAKFRAEIGASEYSSSSSTRKTGYFLNDDDIGDFFSLDVLADHVYGTPVFRLVSGNSSCPWEPGTLPREGVNLNSDEYSQIVDDPNGQAVFHLILGNTSQSDEDMIYNLVFDQSSNPEGAVLTLGGSQVQGGILTPYYIPAGGSKEATVTVKRGPEAFDYQNLQFTLLSGCDDASIRDTVLLDVHFKSSCSHVVLSRPGNNWLINSLDNNRLSIRVSEYDRDLLDFIRIEISDAGLNNWQSISFIDKADLDPGNTSRQISLEEFADGEYEIRAMVECSSGRAYSEILAGQIDRRGPELFGLPEPADLVMDDGDMIMAQFNENVNCYRISSGQLVLKNLSTGESINASVGCNGNTLIIIPDFSGKTFENDTFNVELTGIEDLNGNAMVDPVSWSFTIQADPTPSGSDDTDLDGIINSSDNCPYSKNALQEDLDKDGEGDACDTDLDGDGILNSEDNCLMMVNPDQIDINEDGIGDACQNLTGIANRNSDPGFRFSENYPNPFSEMTTLAFAVPFESQVIMKVFDVTGQEIETLINQRVAPGSHEIVWDATGFQSGIYYCTFYAESLSTNGVNWKTIKMVLAR